MLQRIFLLKDGDSAVKYARQLWVRYAIAVVAIIAAISVSHIVQSEEVEASARDAEIINLSGRQRMLSQRMVLLLQNDPTAVDGSAIDSSFHLAVDEYKSAHIELTLALINYPNAREAYGLGDPAGLDAASAQFIAELLSLHMAEVEGSTEANLDQRRERLREFAVHEMLMRLDAATRAFEADAKARSDRLVWIGRLSLALAFAIILAEITFIFWPAHLLVRRAVEHLDQGLAKEKELNKRLAAQSRDLEKAANRDPLTGLLNRKKLLEELEARIADLDRRYVALCVMNVDLDKFKQVNDTLGHQIGDMVLKNAAEAMEARLRDCNFVGRMGGDEFIIVAEMPNDDSRNERASLLAQSIISRISEPFIIADEAQSISASVGYTFVDSSPCEVRDIIEETDIALYHAKQTQRGTAVRYNSSLREVTQLKLVSSTDD